MRNNRRNEPHYFIGNNYGELPQGNLTRAKCVTNEDCKAFPGRNQQNKMCLSNDPENSYADVMYDLKFKKECDDTYACTNAGFCVDSTSINPFSNIKPLEKGESTLSCNSVKDCIKGPMANQFRDCDIGGQPESCRSVGNISCAPNPYLDGTDLPYGTSANICMSGDRYTYGVLRG